MAERFPKSIRLSNLFQENGNPVLLCPQCDFEYTHQKHVRVYFREKEDSDDGLLVSVSSYLTVEVETKLENTNPSPRRDGLTITFVCEGCSWESYLAVYQHKGKTFVEWVDSYLMPPEEGEPE